MLWFPSAIHLVQRSVWISWRYSRATKLCTVQSLEWIQPRCAFPLLSPFSHDLLRKLENFIIKKKEDAFLWVCLAACLSQGLIFSIRTNTSVKSSDKIRQRGKMEHNFSKRIHFFNLQNQHRIKPKIRFSKFSEKRSKMNFPKLNLYSVIMRNNVITVTLKMTIRKIISSALNGSRWLCCVFRLYSWNNYKDETRLEIWYEIHFTALGP